MKEADNETPGISNAQQMVDLWIKENGVRYFSELTNLLTDTKTIPN